MPLDEVEPRGCELIEAGEGPQPPQLASSLKISPSPSDVIEQKDPVFINRVVRLLRAWGEVCAAMASEVKWGATSC